MFRLKGPILSISFLDSSGVLMLPLSEQWKDRPDSRDREEASARRLRSMPSRGARISPTTSQSVEAPRDSQFVVMASEKQARVVALPSQTALFKATLTETSFVVCAEVLSIKSIGGWQGREPVLLVRPFRQSSGITAQPPPKCTGCSNTTSPTGTCFVLVCTAQFT